MSESAPDSDDEQPAVDYVRKVSVSMPESLIREVRERVGSGSFSRYVTEAVMKRVQMAKLDELIAEHETKCGPIPEDVSERAERAWRELEEKWSREGF